MHTAHYLALIFFSTSRRELNLKPEQDTSFQDYLEDKITITEFAERHGFNREQKDALRKRKNKILKLRRGIN